MTAPSPVQGVDRRGGPPPWIAAVSIAGLVLGVIVIIAQVVGGGGGAGGGAAVAPTLAPAGEAAGRTRDLVSKTLGDESFQVRDPLVAYRPGESPSLVDVPRVILQAVLPSDPTGGYVLVYELPSNNDAAAVGEDFAAYLASGTGAIQYPRDAEFVLRRVGQTLVFFPWSPSVSPDPEVARLAAALGTLGEPIAAP
jgi:hypothetical protein